MMGVILFIAIAIVLLAVFRMQFGLKSIFLVVTTVAVVCGVYRALEPGTRDMLTVIVFGGAMLLGMCALVLSIAWRD